MQIFSRFFCKYGIIFVLLQAEMRRISLILSFLGLSLGLFAQTHTRIYNEQVRTLRVAREVISLVDPEPLQISFDEMSHDVHLYTYTVEMLYSDLLSGEYLQGFTTRDIVDFEHSFNTSREYTHYWFEFPNEDMQLTKSGAYRLIIYEDGNPENKVAEVDFSVVEPLVKIEGKVRANTDIELNGRYQQVDFDVNTAALDLRNPQEVRVLVTQNNRLDNAVELTQPTFMEQNHLKYINNKALIFEGGNEYHHFDAFSRFYAGTGIDRIVYELGDYHALLFPNEPARGEYMHEFDSDGRFVVNAERTNDSDTEAEYMWVHWTLAVDKPWFDGAVYVGGDIFGNELSLKNRMQYDAERQCYWLTALVKQGGYDFQYWFSGKGTQNKTTTQRTDGSYWQTENEYTIYVFWRPFGARYDRLVGVQTLH